MQMTTQEVADALNVVYTTVLNYCDRAADPLPTTIRQKGLVKERTFDSDDVAQWAKRHGIEFRPQE